MAALLLLGLSILPVVVLLIYINKQDKYEKEPPGMLILTFIGGIISAILVLAIPFVDVTEIESYSPFFNAFCVAAIPEELAKFVILFLLIWWNKNFNEHMDGIVYAAFVSLGFACLENILYVFGGGFGTGIVRALISVPGHFLFAVPMGYFLSLAKFNKKRCIIYLILSLLVPILIHGLFDWLLMAADISDNGLGIILLILFVILDIFMWIIGIRSIRKHRENSPFKPNPANPTTGTNY